MKKGDAICVGSNGVCSVTTSRVDDIDSFEVDPPRYSVKFTVTPVEIHVEIFGLPPWNSNDFYSNPLEISIDILNRGFQFFF